MLAANLQSIINQTNIFKNMRNTQALLKSSWNPVSKCQNCLVQRFICKCCLDGSRTKIFPVVRILYSVIFVFDFHLLITLHCKSSVNISVMDLPASHFNQQAAAVLTEKIEKQLLRQILHQKLWRIICWCLQKPSLCQFDSYALLILLRCQI